MKSLKKARIILVLILPFVSCNNNKSFPLTKENTSGIWIASHLYLDKDFYKPISQILEFKEDSIYYRTLDGEMIGKQHIEFLKDSVIVDSNAFSYQKFNIINNHELSIGSIRGWRFSNRASLDVIKFDSILSSTYWQIEDNPEIYQFDNTKKEMRVINGDKTYNKYCYSFHSIEGDLFLQKKGNQLSCDRDNQFVEQVVSYAEDKIVTYGFHKGEFKEINYIPVKFDANTLTHVPFQLCNMYLNKNFPPDRYYYKGTEYNGGLYNVRKIFKENYQIPLENKESGIFQVRFVVNCEGKAGMYESQAFDYDYKPKKISPEISTQILKITKSLQDWIPGKRKRTNQVIDTYIYISFRIKDGKIIRIYP
ncbi:hypothetical protein U6A24_16040 [Aquimarina gracilis]|uniref:TonB C-terminal domain-containing protein n=1 Tax=Aquimarina gracilis TaxID=874422 RepID=A0ABU5ZYP1_9FLAO|nr:hypothetical protein [Aquimarina gracilis]MEB3346986.1 hypothetical protein [Aquimarina gracilis]